MAASIELNAVSRRLGHRSVLDNFSAALSPGERMALLGPSGCGKTTVLRLVAGLLSPDAGSVVINDQIVSSAGQVLVPPERRNVGMVFQDLALWPHLTVEGNLRFGLSARKVRRTDADDRIRRTLKMVGLADRARSRPGGLSGGEQQRVALARALVLEPGVLLMDEPLSSLDFELALRLRREILELHERLGFTLLYVTHNREEAAEIGQRILVMKNV